MMDGIRLMIDETEEDSTNGADRQNCMRSTNSMMVLVTWSLTPFISFGVLAQNVLFLFKTISIILELFFYFFIFFNISFVSFKSLLICTRGKCLK